jgi:hypothetical protein
MLIMFCNLYNFLTVKINHLLVAHTNIQGWARNFKMLRHKSKRQFENPERNTQNPIALLNYLKHITPQQLILRTQVFKKKFLRA